MAGHFPRRVWLLALTALLSAGPARAQTDPTAISADCLADLERAQEALDAEDSGRALVHLDMATEPCANARQGLVSLIADSPEASRSGGWSCAARGF
jgi:hypothetical protein